MVNLCTFHSICILSCLYVALSYFSNITQSTGKAGEEIFSAFESFEYPWDVQAKMLLLLCLLNVFRIFYRVTHRFFKNTTQRSALRLESYE